MLPHFTSNVKGLIAFLWLVLGVSLDAEVVVAHPCNDWLSEASTARALSVPFFDPGTLRVHLDLEKQTPAAIITELRPRWIKIGTASQLKSIARVFLTEGKDASGAVLSHYRQVQRVRMEASTSLSGSNKREKRIKQAIQNWLKAERQMHEWVLENVPPNRERIFLLNEILGEKLYFNGTKPGVARAKNLYVTVGDDRGVIEQKVLDWKDVRLSLELFENWYRMAEDLLEPVVLAAEAYQRLNTIHPFGDANGRTSRMLMDWILLAHDLPPVIFPDAESLHVSVFPDDRLGQNPEPGSVLRRVTEAMERTVAIFEGPWMMFDAWY